MPAGKQLNIDETFESQKELVIKKIIPALVKELDMEIYQAGDAVLYELIHQRHRHQREELLRKRKQPSEQTKELRRRHGNSRRNEVIHQ